MLIKSFSVKNYRSITKANELPLSNFSILVGPNNEGKSNLLRALILSLRFIESPKKILQKTIPRNSSYRIQRHIEPDIFYNFDVDYPLNVIKQSNSYSNFEIIFELSDEEKINLTSLTKKKIKGDLKISLSFGKFDPKITINDTKTAKLKLEKFQEKIFPFVSERIMVSYIPAIRDSNTVLFTIEDMISRELSSLEDTKKYQKLLKDFDELQTKILKPLEHALLKSTKEFLPNITQIRIDSEERLRMISKLVPSVYVNDGTETILEQKGDGIKSLFAISLIQHLTKQKAAKKSIILAIEEPESHLHPDAIHKIRDVLEEISTKNQVIISTHSPLLVERHEISRNLIVKDSQVFPAKSLDQIRIAIGVAIGDNLVSADIVLITEGDTDAEILKTLLSEISPRIQYAIKNNIIRFDPLRGASNLSYQVGKWKSLLTPVFIILDNDDEGRNKVDEAKNRKIISDKEVTILSMMGFHDSEIEDFIKPGFYEDEIKSQCRLDLKVSSEFKSNKGKWSTRIHSACKKQGVPFSDANQEKMKQIVTRNVCKFGMISIKDPLKELFKNLASNIEKDLEMILKLPKVN